MKRVLSTVLGAIFTVQLGMAGVLPGIDVLELQNFTQLQGKRVGLITNATGVDSHGNSTVDVLMHAPGVKLVALFGPEHGVYGSDYAGASVSSTRDPHTGLPVFSLYGATKKPTPEMLKGVDVLVYDIQDIGCRSYTFISTLGLAMEGAAEAHIPFCVLDRPDPLGGDRVEGMMVSGQTSFVAPYNIPYVYGLTPGELAQLIVKKHWSAQSPSLTVVPMQGWRRTMMWDETGLIWVPSSPHVPTAESAFDYVVTGMLGEAGGVNHGIGYTVPFGLVGHPSLDSFEFTATLKAMPHPGALFIPATWKPFYQAFKGQVVHGSQIFLIDKHQANLCGLAVNILYALVHQPSVHLFVSDPTWDSGPAQFDEEAGGSGLRKDLLAGKTSEQIEASWQAGLNVFKEERKSCLIAGYGE